MTRKRITGRRLIVFILFLILLTTVVLYPDLSFRAARTYWIYAKYSFRPSNSGVGYVYNRDVLNLSTLPWGIRKPELEFLISDRLLHLWDYRTPVVAELLRETENSISYRFSDGRTVAFYFNSRGRYYKAVQRIGPSEGAGVISVFSWYNSIWVGKVLFGYMNWNRHYNGTSFEMKWINDTLSSGYELYTDDFEALGRFIRDVQDGIISLDEYPGLEVYHRIEFNGMIIEHFLKQYHENPFLMTMERVYTSSVLSGN